MWSEQVEAMEAEMAHELQREAQAQSAARNEGDEGIAMQAGGPALVLDEAAGTSGSEGQRCGLASLSASCLANHVQVKRRLKTGP